MKVTINVEGMSCGHCEKTVKDTLENIKGVQSVEVFLDSGKVDVRYDEAVVTVAKMNEAIEEQGYDVKA